MPPNHLPNPIQLAAERFVECRHTAFWRYWRRRRVTPETLDAFQIGWNPPWPVLEHPYADVQAYLAAGFFHRKRFAATGVLENRYIDCYTFPYVEDGVVCGMVFRVAHPGPRDLRYYNLERVDHLPWPPGRVVRPLYFGADGAIHNELVTVVEGPVDMLRAWQAGLPNPLAVCGLGVTDDQILDLLTHPRRVYLMLDWDDDGITKTFGIAIRYLRYRHEQEHGIAASHLLQQYPGQLVIVAPDADELGWADKDPGGAPDDAALQQAFEEWQFTPEDYVERIVRRSVDLDDPAVRHAIDRFVLSGGLLGRELDRPLRPRVRRPVG